MFWKCEVRLQHAWCKSRPIQSSVHLPENNVSSPVGFPRFNQSKVSSNGFFHYVVPAIELLHLCTMRGIQKDSETCTQGDNGKKKTNPLENRKKGWEEMWRPWVDYRHMSRYQNRTPVVCQYHLSVSKFTCLFKLSCLKSTVCITSDDRNKKRKHKIKPLLPCGVKR